MDELSKNIQDIENNISRYIYKKYIVKQQHIIDNHYKIYLQKIFDVKRIKFRICQQDIIKEDLKRMSISDIAYNFNPTNFKPKDYDILPNILRCTYIRKHKNKYYRCLNKNIQINNTHVKNDTLDNTLDNNDNDNDDNDDEDEDEDKLCAIHDNCYNIYLDKYITLIKLYTQVLNNTLQNT